MAPERTLSVSSAGSVVRKPYAKAERSSKACDKCHARKTRCSGTTPCLFCSSRKLECIYSDHNSSARASSSYYPSPDAPSATLKPLHIRAPMSVEPLQSPSYKKADLSPAPPPAQISPGSQISTSDRASMASPDPRMREEEYSVSGLVLTRTQREPPPCVEPDIPSLIDRRSSTKFFDAYFSEAEWIYQLHPVQERMSLQHEAIWGDAGVELPTGARTVLAALLALGALFLRQPVESEKLYQAARKSYLDVTDLVTLQSVQLAMQMVVYEINASRSASLWSSLATAVRLAQALNLHRKPALANKDEEESLQRQQLWWCCRVHDTWHALTTGRPCLIDDSDCDLDRPWESQYLYPGQRPLAFDIFAMRIKLSAIWGKIHTTLYTRQALAQSDQHWLEALPILDADLQTWHQELDQILPPTNLTAQRSDKKQLQCVSLAQGVARIILHRSFLIRPFTSEPSATYDRQKLVSERAVLDGAFQVLSTSRKLIELGVHLSFWFLTSNLQISALACCERARGASLDPSRHEELAAANNGFQEGLHLLQEIERSGDNAFAGQVAHAVQVIQAAGGLVRPATGQGVFIDSGTCGSMTEAPGPSRSFSPALFPPQSITLSTDSAWALGNPDLDWLASLCNTTDLGDPFFSNSPYQAPAAGNLAWWCA